MKLHQKIALFACIIALAGGSLLPAGEKITAKNYERAWKMMSPDLHDHITGEVQNRGWLDHGRLWFCRSTADGPSWFIADPQSKKIRKAFDHEKLAAALSAASGKELAADDLPVRRISLKDNGKALVYNTEKHRYQCDLTTYRCVEKEKEGPDKTYYNNASFSPDDRYRAFIRDHDLWAEDLKSGKSIRLTEDGRKDFGYATNNAGWTRNEHPVLLWAPGSDKIATFQQDARGVQEMTLVPTGVGHPEVETWKYPLPGDEHIFRLQRVIIHLDPLRVVRLQMDPDPQRSSITDHVAGRGGKLLDARWSPDGTRLAFVSTSRNHQTVTLRVADADTGEVRDVLTETTKTYFESGYSEPNWRILWDRNEVLWFSERNNWGHLYLYDLKSGRLKRQVTRGTLNCKKIVKLEEKRGRLYFTGSCREAGNPYYDYLYTVRLNGRGLRCLTPDRGHHRISLSPCKKYMIHTVSTVSRPPAVTLETLSGRRILTLAEADISELLATGWKPPEVIRARGRDGKTDCYGLMYKPSHFDPSRSYPVINYIYPGPQSGSVRGFSFSAVSGNRGLAELGFIVVAVNGMGTPGRSKSFHDTWYGNMGDNTIPDQIAVMKALAEEHPWIDLDHVGIYGHSGGGNASTTAILQYPDFFHVAVSQSGNHDNRIYEAPWGEKWQGLYEEYEDGSTNYDNQANQRLAGNLKGKLLLAHGMMDDNVMPYSTLLVVQELIKHNRDFDLLLFPNSRHGYRYRDYMTRRRWDYFVTHLLGQTPPREFDHRKMK